MSAPRRAVVRRSPSVQQRLRRSADLLNPFLSSPSGPLEALAWLESFEPSLMPRTSSLQGLAGGLSVLSARAVAALAERALPARDADGTAPWPRWAWRASSAALGMAVASLPERPGESLWRSGARTGGRLLRVAALGGAIHDLGQEARARGAEAQGVRALAMSSAALGGLGIWAGRRLTERTDSIEPWPVEQRSTVPASAFAAVVTTAVGMGVFRGYMLTRDRWIAYLGRSPVAQGLARTVNAAVWGLGAVAGYQAGVTSIGRANERVEPGYAAPPPPPFVSGAVGSVSSFADLGQQGRRFVTDTVTPRLVEEVLDEPAITHPIRVFVGFDSEPLYQTGRAELALEELERSGAYDRAHLLLVSPTGTGWVDQTMVETAELLTRGDIATAAIQYARYPSFLSLQKVALGGSQFRLLLLGVKQRLRERPPERRPKVLVFGESLGAWSSSDVVMFSGISGLDHYGVDRALWVGLPGLAKWSRNGMARGGSALVPSGTVRVVDHPEQLEGLSEEERAGLRVVILSHDNDPIAQLVPDLIVRRPPWLADDGRGRGVPPQMRWRPFVTFWQTAVDAANAMVTVPGEFRSHGHDYRADMARVVRDAFALPAVRDDQLAAVEATLRRLEVDRAARIAAAAGEPTPPAPAHRAAAGQQPPVIGIPLRRRRSRGALWRRAG